MRQGLAQRTIAARGWALGAEEAIRLAAAREVALIDLRERSERERHGVIPGSLHAPYADLRENLAPSGILHELASVAGRRLAFYCAFGARSAMAVQATQDAGLTSACHVEGGIDAWKKADGAVVNG